MTFNTGGISERTTDVPTKVVAIVEQMMPQIRQQCHDVTLTLVRVKGYRTQVVSGVKYLVDLEVTDAAGRVSTPSVTIWQKPDQTFEVTDCHASAS